MSKFVKGDPRINRKGRPKSFDALRALAQEIAHEEATKDKEPIIINGHIATATEIVLRQWLMSNNFQKQLAFFHYAYGKVPDNLDLTSGGKPLNVKGYVSISPDDWQAIADNKPDSDV